MKIRADDTVLIIKGKDRGKQAKVKSIFPDQNRVIVEGINIALRHTKANQTVRQAGIIQKALPIAVANIVLICSNCNKPTKVGLKIMDDGTKARVCGKCSYEQL